MRMCADTTRTSIFPSFDASNRSLSFCKLLGMVSSQLNGHISMLSVTTMPEAQWAVAVISVALAVITYLLQRKDDTVPDNVRLKIEAVSFPNSY